MLLCRSIIRILCYEQFVCEIMNWANGTGIGDREDRVRLLRYLVMGKRECLMAS
jgi:hypothetical protein